jgi:branched-chain amino acid transport system ATP-binding protein
MSASGHDTPTLHRTVLQVSGLNAYYWRAQVLFDVAINPDDGAVTALLGRNGAGKSTLLKSIAGAPGIRKSGSVSFDGRPVLGSRAHDLARAGIVLIPEDRRIFANLTVRANLNLGRIAAQHGDRSSGRVDDVVELMPNLRPLLDRGGQQLSGGEQQMVAIGRALMANPRLLLMDEPSTGLAPVVLDDLRAGIRRLAEASSMTIILSEQNSAFALSLCSHVIVIDRGRIVFGGTKDDFLADPHLRTNYLSV